MNQHLEPDRAHVRIVGPIARKFSVAPSSLIRSRTALAFSSSSSGPYLGRFCSIRLRDVSADHFAIVEDPADRRCRLTTRGVPGRGTRNLMTWVVTPAADGQQTPESAIGAVMMVTNED